MINLTIAIGLGLYMISCLITDRMYIGQAEYLIYRLGKHKN